LKPNIGFRPNLRVGSAFQILNILQVCLRVETRNRLDLEPESNVGKGTAKKKASYEFDWAPAGILDFKKQEG